MSTLQNSTAAINRPSVVVFPDRIEMGAAAAAYVQAEVRRIVAENESCRMIMACAPSQDEFYASLAAEANADPDIWKKVEIFHMDDYVGLSAEHPQSFRHYLKRHFLDHVQVGIFHPIRGEASDIQGEAVRYAALLNGAPIDVICLGIGENGHIAFNDPPVADFDDPVAVKVVELDEICRQQQVNDGCFNSIADVPRRAFTITLRVFADAGLLSCVVPSKLKARAVRDALTMPISVECPATLLRTHPRSTLFLDSDAASLLPPELLNGNPAAE